MQHSKTMNQEAQQPKETSAASPAALPVLSLVDETESVLSGDLAGDPNATIYKYRDFSTVNEDDEDAVSTPDGPVSAASRNSMETSIRVQKFPVKLYSILAQKEFHDIITWMPHGRSWKVLKPNVFESLVMPLFFEYSNYHSFNRLVNAWSFRRVSSGPDRGSYYHELFLRGKPHLQKYMRRLPKTHKKLPMRKQDEPDFYLLDKTNPLPSIEDAPIPGGISVSNAMRGPMQGVQGNMGGVPPPQPMGMPGRMMPPSGVSHVPQPRFPQGIYGADPLQGQDDFGDMAGQGERAMMSRGLLQSNNGAFRTPMQPGQGMPQGMSGTAQGFRVQQPGAGMGMAQLPSANRMAPQMGGRVMPGQMYPSGMSNQFMNQMQSGSPNRMNAAGMRRFRPLQGMDSGMGMDQGMMSAGYPQDQVQDDFYPQHRQQAPMRRMPMDQMAPMQQMYNDRTGMGQDQLQNPYGDLQSGKSDVYGGNNYRDMQGVGGDFMYREGSMPLSGSDDFVSMVSPVRRSRP